LKLIYRILLTLGASLVFYAAGPYFDVPITFAKALVVAIVIQTIGFLLASDKEVQVALLPASLFEMKDEKKTEGDE
jgi:hypothetical protein